MLRKAAGPCEAHDKVLPYPGVVPTAPVNDDFAPGFMVDLMRKDLGLAMAAAKGLKAPALLASVAHELFGAAANLGYGRRDMSAVVKAVEALTGTLDE